MNNERPIGIASCSLFVVHCSLLVGEHAFYLVPIELCDVLGLHFCECGPRQQRRVRLAGTAVDRRWDARPKLLWKLRPKARDQLSRVDRLALVVEQEFVSQRVPEKFGGTRTRLSQLRRHRGLRVPEAYRRLELRILGPKLLHVRRGRLKLRHLRLSFLGRSGRGLFC